MLGHTQSQAERNVSLSHSAVANSECERNQNQALHNSTLHGKPADTAMETLLRSQQNMSACATLDWQTPVALSFATWSTFSIYSRFHSRQLHTHRKTASNTYP